jgi:hypothetical protein
MNHAFGAIEEALGMSWGLWGACPTWHKGFLTLTGVLLTGLMTAAV